MESDSLRYCTKKTGKTEVEPFHDSSDIKNMIEYFLLKEQWNHYLTFMFGLLLGRRVGDCLSLKWSDLYYANGKFKDSISTLEEEKTGKQTNPHLCGAIKKAITLYTEKMKIDVRTQLEEEVFPSKLKDQYTLNEKWDGYKGSTTIAVDKNTVLSSIKRWSTLLHKENLKATDPNYLYDLWIQRNSKRKSLSLEEFLRKMEYSLAIRSLSAAYRAAFSIAADFCGIQYPVSTHSPRKSFGLWSRKLHPNDMDSMLILQKIYGHSDQQITMAYIGLTREKEVSYYNDMGDFVDGVMAGNKFVIKNSPVVSINSEDLRDILMLAYTEGQNRKENDSASAHINIMNQLLTMIEECRVS